MWGKMQDAALALIHEHCRVQGILFRKTNRLILSDADIWGEVLEVVDGVVLVFESPAEEAALCLGAFISKLGGIGTLPPFIVFHGTGQSGSQSHHSIGNFLVSQHLSQIITINAPASCLWD